MKLKSIFFICWVMFDLSACAVTGERKVNISEAQIQQKLNEKLAVPISLLKIFDIQLSNSLVKFDPTTGRMQTTLDTQLSSQMFKENLSGKLGISGKLRFDATTSSIVLDEPKVERFDLNGLNGKNGVDNKYADLMGAFAKTIGSEMLNGLTLYSVKPEDLNIGGTQYNPKDLQVTNQGLQITLSPQR